MPDNDLVLNDNRVSRHHCAITGTPAGFVLTDLQSTHGTTVNGERLTMPAPLADGDELVVGEDKIRFSSASGLARPDRAERRRVVLRLVRQFRGPPHRRSGSSRQGPRLALAE